MRRLGILVFSTCCILLAFNYSKPDDFRVLEGPYLGQKPPGMTPKLFAPGIVKTDDNEGCSGWGKNMEYFVFQRWSDGKPQIYIMNQKSGAWSAPKSLPFVNKYRVGDFTIAPDGKTMVFASRILIDEIGSNSDGANIWIVEKTETGWTEPKHIGLGINTKFHESYPCLTSNCNLYFFSRRPGGYGDSDLYLSEFIDGKYQPPVNLGPKLNTKYHEWDTYTAPDESYMIYCSMKPDSLGSDDLYVTFKSSNGFWSDPVHMGNKINSDRSENRPYVSPDGKYFFYASNKGGNRDIYWVDARIIEELKKESEFPVLKGPYLGQKPPGLNPEVFAPGIISTEVSEGCSYFSKDGQLYLFGRGGSVEPGIFIMEQKDGVWSRPQLAPFSAGRHDWDFTLAPDGKTVFVASGRPHTKEGSPERDHSIWISERTKAGWTEPQLLPFPVNAGQHDSYPSATEDGTLYFFSRRSGGLGEGDIYKSEKIDGKYTKVQNLGPPINTKYHEVDPFIAPDESYMILCSDLPGGYGKADIYVSFQREAGSWTEPMNLGETVNTPFDEYIPAVTPDGKYFFFTTNKTGNRDIYWVDAQTIKKLKPEN